MAFNTPIISIGIAVFTIFIAYLVASNSWVSEFHVFDEATSSLDYQSEKIINKSIMEIAKDRTVLIVAHRLSFIIGAKKVIVMDEGKIIDAGSHIELMARCNEYIKLFKAQYNLKERIFI